MKKRRAFCLGRHQVPPTPKYSKKTDEKKAGILFRETPGLLGGVGAGRGGRWVGWVWYYYVHTQKQTHKHTETSTHTTTKTRR